MIRNWVWIYLGWYLAIFLYCWFNVTRSDPTIFFIRKTRQKFELHYRHFATSLSNLQLRLGLRKEKEVLEG